MSSILFSNPFAPPPSQSQPPSGGDQGQPDQTVQPADDTQSSGGADNNPANSGQGNNAGGNSNNSAGSNQPPAEPEQAIVPAPPRPANATANSVVAAQASRPSIELLPDDTLLVDETSARNAALAAQAKALDTALIDRLNAPKEDVEVKKPVTSKDLPPPLPTSPFLKQLAESG